MAAAKKAVDDKAKPVTKAQAQDVLVGFTEPEVRAFHGMLGKAKPNLKTPITQIETELRGMIAKQGLSRSDLRVMLQKAAAPTKAARQPGTPERKPAPGGGKHPVHQREPAKKEAPAKKASVAPTGQSKHDIIKNAISAKGGASLTTLMNLTGWKPHSVRGAVATMRTQGGLDIKSEKRGTDRIYTLTEGKMKAAAANTRKPARKVAKKTARKGR